MSDTASKIEHRTVDGVPVKVGDIVWRVRQYCGICKRKLDRNDLGAWWWSIKTEIYSTEFAAIVGAIESEKHAIAKAKKEASRALRAIERLMKRLAKTKESR